MRQKSMRIAAVVAIVVALVCAVDLGTGSTALSQTRHAVNTTLAWLKSMIVGGPAVEPPMPSEIAEQTVESGRRIVTYTTRFFKVSTNERGVWQSFKEQGIEFAQVSADPEVYYATLSREQAQSFGTSVTLKCLAAPRITMLEGESGAIAMHDNTPQGPRGLAVAVLASVSDDGKEIESTLSFHDGRNGFEIPGVSTESGGAVLIRAKGVFPDSEQESDGSAEVLMCVQADAQ